MEYEKLTLDNKIFRFIYVGAMRDAVVQLAYKGKKKWLLGSDVQNVLKNKIEPLINNVLNDTYSSQQNYDEDFLNTAISICEYINNIAKNNEFTFGNAQKFINIMLKYFYITSYKDDVAKEKFRFCHCPMDHQLLINLWNNRNNLEKEILLGKRDFFLKSWSNEDFEINEDGKKKYPRRYILFQQAVRNIAKDMNPLEYDYTVWLSS